MCGIAGLLNFSGKTPAAPQIERMIDQQRHRGPDGQGTMCRDGVALGHRRLSVIDLAGGSQPMTNETRDIWLTFNGEIYNFRELRHQLTSVGHVFRTESDAEVLVHAYEQWGEDCVRHLRGMFAFGIADFRERKLFLARDHLGIKPLFYRVEREGVAFASELQPLQNLDGQRPDINLQAIDYYLRYRYVPAPHTIYQNILRLPPAHYWTCDFDGRATMPYEYYRLPLPSPSSHSEAEWVEQFGEVLDESVSAHLSSDVPLGAFLSGGVDSTLIVAAMARQQQRPVQAFHVSFADTAYCERDYARQAAEKLGVQLHTEVIRPDVVAILDSLFNRFGEPFADTSAIPTWCLSQLARQHVTVALSGDGADEAFAGYDRYDRLARENLLGDLTAIVKYPRRALRNLVARWRGTWPSRAERWQQRHVGIVPVSIRRELWRPEYQAVVGVPSSAFSNANRRGRNLADVQYGQYVDLKTYLPGDILTKVDVASMCHGLETRTPFVDLRVLEFAATLPSCWRRTNTGKGTAALKPLPKRYLTLRFRNSYVRRPKQGFAIPEAAWLRRGSPIRQRLDDVLNRSEGPLDAYFDPQCVRRLVTDFDQSGRHATSLWLLMILGMWMDQPVEATSLRSAA